MEEEESAGLENGEVEILKDARNKCNLEAEEEASVDAPRPGSHFPGARATLVSPLSAGRCDDQPKSALMVRGGGFGSFQRRYLRVDRDGQRDNMLGFCEMCLPNTMAENTMFRQCSRPTSHQGAEWMRSPAQNGLTSTTIPASPLPSP